MRRAALQLRRPEDAIGRGSPRSPRHDTAAAMFNLVSLIIGFVALICALVAFIPLLGWANWLIIPLAIIGAVIGMISRGTAGRNLNLFVIVIGVVRLMLGGGIL
jgi:fatty acid desaturase